MAPAPVHELVMSREGLRRHQRKRLLDAMVQLAAERGLGEVSLRGVLARARVSRKAFYELFASLEDVLVAVIDDALARVSTLVLEAFERERAWQDGLRGALASVLTLLDSEPALAKVCIVEVLAAGPNALARRERNLGALRALITEQVGIDVEPALLLAIEGVMASVMGIVHARLLAAESEPLLELLGPLMGLIVGAHLGAVAAEPEIVRGEALAQALLAQRSPTPPQFSAVTTPTTIPSLLSHPAAYRARLCVFYLEQCPGASNREIANGIGVSHQGQTSLLLARLTKEGLLTKQSHGLGHANAWQLTEHGQAVAQALKQQH
jgi:AcrR family transcriptional regulator